MGSTLPTLGVGESKSPNAPNDMPMPRAMHEWPRQNANGYQILEQPFGTMRPMRVIFIGAGASGICFSKFAEDMLTNVNVQIYDKNHDIGGTWLENRYVVLNLSAEELSQLNGRILVTLDVLATFHRWHINSLGVAIPSGPSTTQVLEKSGNT